MSKLEHGGANPGLVTQNIVEGIVLVRPRAIYSSFYSPCILRIKNLHQVLAAGEVQLLWEKLVQVGYFFLYGTLGPGISDFGCRQTPHSKTNPQVSVTGHHSATQCLRISIL
jgi:hypothetical protein